MNYPNHLPTELRRVYGATAERRAQAQAASELICRLGGYRWTGLYDVEAEEIAVIGWCGIDVESAKANAFGERDRRLLAECAEALKPLWLEQSRSA